ncbi:MAG: hypothetical protein H5T65_08030 [Chloroflexi bacterium]|nr:hypothetical protein [Chloroflexota bacterium]
METTDFLMYLRVIWKRAWLIGLIVALTVGVILLTSLTAGPVYQATVRLQVIASEPGDVALFSEFRSGPAAEEISTAQQDFIAALKRPIVAWQTIADLNLGISAVDLLDRMTVGTEEEFIYISYEADSPQDAETIVTKLVDNALVYYRNLRAKRATVLRVFIAQELEKQQKSLASAKEAFLQFKLQHNLDSLQRELTAYQDELRQLRFSRDMVVMQGEQKSREATLYQEQADKATQQAEEAAARGATGTASYYYGLARDYAQKAAEARISAEAAQVARLEYEQMISDRETRLLSLIGLTSEYDAKQTAVNEIQANVNFLSGKLNEAALKESQSLNAGFIQVAEPARQPDRPAPSQLPRLLLVGVAISAAAGIILAFVLEFIESLGRPKPGTQAQ